MTKIRSFDQANQILASYIPRVKEITGKDITLQRMVPLMKLLGNPEAKFKVIHVAGTSGKTSTAYYIASFLQAAGKKVGLTVSPHIDSVTERIQVNLTPLSDQEFCKLLSEFLALIENAQTQPTYYELLVAFAYWYFARIKVDYAVVETGLGGLHDATNIAGRNDKVCVITDIGLDHTKILGNTLSKIAAQKAGIIHSHNEVFCYKQGRTVMRVFRETCALQQASLHEISMPNQDEPANALPLFQRRNWFLAKNVYEHIAKRHKLDTLNEAGLAGTMSTRIPARMEIVMHKNKTIIMDGAHNPQKLHALVSSIRHSYPAATVAVLAGFVQSRKPRLHGNLRQLLPIADYLLVTSFVPNQEMHNKSANPQLVAEYCQELHYKNYELEPNPLVAMEKLLKRNEDILLVTGSFYLMYYIRPLIINKHD